MLESVSGSRDKVKKELENKSFIISAERFHDDVDCERPAEPQSWCRTTSKFRSEALRRFPALARRKPTRRTAHMIGPQSSALSKCTKGQEEEYDGNGQGNGYCEGYHFEKTLI